ncbi:hypothetical protein PIB30_068835 [Stylosanthes scabra]|uniref:Uncharacterized protein n=1 Tax=Stylosanthes scabra TaxID=79078 RepID=A0ABU6WLE9_9FABA|nr:hypothetical protein [Stylosanthes scabra]
MESESDSEEHSGARQLKRKAWIAGSGNNAKNMAERRIEGLSQIMDTRTEVQASKTQPIEEEIEVQIEEDTNEEHAKEMDMEDLIMMNKIKELKGTGRNDGRDDASNMDNIIRDVLKEFAQAGAQKLKSALKTNETGNKEQDKGKEVVTWEQRNERAAKKKYKTRECS